MLLSQSRRATNGLKILCLDDGDERCLSQLRILKEYFHRLEMDRGGETVKVCQYFDFIVGAGGGGVIAVLLGVLGMNLDQASIAFRRMCSATLFGAARSLTPEERTQRLEETIKEILLQCQIPLDRRFNSDVDLSDDCKVAIAYQSAARLGQCNFFRNYDSRRLSPNPTILQVVLATWATPTLFSATKIPVDIALESVVSAAGAFSNPIFEAIHESHEGYGPEQLVSCILSLGSGGQSSRMTELDFKNMVVRCAKDAATTAEEAQRRLGSSGRYFRLSVSPSIDDGTMEEVDAVGVISASTSQYLLLTYQSELVDACLNASERKGGIDLGSLAQVQGTAATSTHGLPPLSPFFVTRNEPIHRMYEGIIRGRTGDQNVLILSGLGGSGKTQLSIRFALQYGELFQHVLFIDASSAKSIEDGLLARVRSVVPSFRGIDYRDAIDILEHPNGKLTARWLIIFDNADDDSVSIQEYMPSCRHGSIIITTRNPSLSNLAPETHIALDIMSDEEATDALLSSALEVNEERTTRHKQLAKEIVGQLGHLPVAIVQAGCYIKKQRCFWEYPSRLNSNRAKLLRHHTVQRDRLKYKYGVYAAFDTTLRVLSSRALNLLGIFSCMHFTNIPRELFTLAATYGFEYQPFDLSPRSDEFLESVSLLQETLTPSDDKQLYESDLDEVLDELYQYSLVAFVPVHSAITIRLHPLLHSWAGDRLTSQERMKFRAITARLLASCMNDIDSHIFDHISPHITAMVPFMEGLHINERAAFCRSIGWDGNYTLLLSTWKDIYAKVEDIYGDKDIRTSVAALELADAYGENGDIEKMEEMERVLVATRSAVYGPDSLETMDALLNLSCTLVYDKSEYKEGEEGVLKTLEIRRHILGSQHLDVFKSLFELGSIQRITKRYSEAITTFLEAIEISTALLGRNHRETLNSLRLLALCYEAQQNPDAQTIMRELYQTQERVLGPKHPGTLSSLHQVGESCYNMGDYAQAEESFRRELRIRRESDGPQSTGAITAIHWLATALYAQGSYLEAGSLFREEVVARSARGLESAHAKSWLGAALFLEQEDSEEAEEIFQQYTSWVRERRTSPHVDISDGLYWTGRSRLGRAKYPEAIEALEESILIRTQLESEDDPNAVHAKHLLGIARRRLEESQEIISG